jgi:hypothetical protein
MQKRGEMISCTIYSSIWKGEAGINTQFGRKKNGTRKRFGMI